MQQHSKEWLGKRAQEILGRNTPRNKVATREQKPATTVMAQCCGRTAFNYWMSADQEQPFVMVAGPLTLAEAEGDLRARFDDPTIRVERFIRRSEQHD